MCPRIRRMILAAVLGVVGGVGAASAQAPQRMPSAPGSLPDVTAPIIATPAQAAPAAPIQVAPIAPVPYAVAAAPSTGGCCGNTTPAPCSDDCDPCADKSRKHRLGGGGLFHRASIGEGCANPIGCGSCASEKTFLFGGCNQFFNPGNQCGNGGLLGGGCGGAGCGGSGFLGRLCNRNCHFTPLGTSGLSSPPCTYTSYVNR